MTKTYEQRLSDLATEMAKAMWDNTYTTDFDNVLDNVQPLKEWAIENHKPLAAIALKHMAEEWEQGYIYAHCDDLTERAGGFPLAVKEHLIINGLIQPQKP